LKKVLIGLGVFIGFIVIMGSVVFIGLSSNMKKIRAIEINNIEISGVSDQTVVGEYYYEDQIGATVEVTIENGMITEIVFIEHIAGLGEKAEIITEDIINEQSLEVDAVSGATTSSHVIKLAIQNALEGIE
jgi:uncharacterized protein with FMN-binding domain